MNSNGNLYSNLMIRSFDLFEEARQESLKLMNQNRTSELRNCWRKLIDVTRSATVVSSYEEFHLESAKKTAVIVTGLSCTGKSTVARVLSEQYKTFDVIGFDEIGMQLLKANMFKYTINPGLLDNDMVIRMGELIQSAAKKNRNLIIEGEYCSINSRGSILKALRTLGYKKIYIISTLSAPAHVQRICAEKRALIQLYAEKLEMHENVDFMLKTFKTDVMPEIQSSIDVQKLMKTLRFCQQVQEIEEQRKQEWIVDMIPIQIEHNLLLAGADSFAEWF